jgi:hypothetical protein
LVNDPESLPKNHSLLKIIEFRKNEWKAIQRIKTYEIENPDFFKDIEETVTRSSKPY